ncbi:hypothetical protein ACWDT6_19665 [Nocardia grenadensis]
MSSPTNRQLIEYRLCNAQKYDKVTNEAAKPTTPAAPPRAPRTFVTWRTWTP